MTTTDTGQFDSILIELRENRRQIQALSVLIAERMIPKEEVEALVKGAWVNAKPTAGLTWNKEMTGDNFVALMRRTGGDSAKFGRVCEVGPGYGRVLKTILGGAGTMDSYLGVDLSKANVEHLSTTFGSERIRFMVGDFVKDHLPGQFDTVYSSAVFMHLYPSIEGALKKCMSLLAPGGRVYFDVPIGDRRYIDSQYKLYVRHYKEAELKEFVQQAGFSSCEVAVEEEFSPGSKGFFVCARK